MITSEKFDRKQFYQPAVDTISLILGLPACIWLTDETGKTLKIVAATGLSDEYIRKASLRLDESGIVSEVFKAEKTIVVPDIASDDRWKYRAEAAAMGFKSAIVVPLRVEGKIVGVFDVYTHEVRDFSDFEKALIEKLAAQMVTSAIRNAQLLEQATNRAEALQKLHQIGGQILSAEFSAQGLRKVLRQVAQSAKSVLDTDLVDVYRYVEAENRWILPPVLGGERRGPEVVKDEIFEDDVVVKVVKGKEPIYITDAQNAPMLAVQFTVRRFQRPEKRFVVREGILSSAAVPLMAAGETVGVMFVNYRRRQAFTPDQRDIIELFANQAALAIYNARVYERDQARLQERVGDIKALQKIYAFIGTASLKDVLEQIAEEAARLTPAKYTGVWLVDERKHELRFGAMNEREQPPARDWSKISLDKPSINTHVIQTGEPYRCDDVVKPDPDPYYQMWYKDVRSELTVPLKYGERVIGTLNLESTRVGAFTDDHVRLVEALAEAAAVAIHSARLYKAIRTVNEVGQAMTSSIQMGEEEILNLIHAQASKLMDTDNMYIALYDEAADTVRFGLVFVNGKRIDIRKEIGYQPRRAGKGKTEEIIHTKKPLFHATKVEAETWYIQPGHEEYVGTALPSWMGVPMMVGGKVLGVIAIYHPTRERVYSGDDLEILQAMANQAAIALDNARLYEETRKLQDEVVATKQLATLGTVMAALQHRINNTFNIIVPNVTRLRKRVDMTDATIVEILDIIERNARYTSDIIKRIQDPLRASEVQEVNINAVLNDVVGELRELRRADSTQALILPTVNLDESIPNIQASSAQIAEVFRNLANNACRAMKEGGQLTIASQLDDGKICVRVQDTGPGIPPRIQQRLFNQPVPSKEPGGGAGLGLWLSRLMLQSIGGDVIIEETSSTGTTMLVQIPMPGGGEERGI